MNRLLLLNSCEIIKFDDNKDFEPRLPFLYPGYAQDVLQGDMVGFYYIRTQVGVMYKM